METVDFTGEIRISSRIIDYLSSGLYNTPGACLKELVNNSFDADAQNVNVFVRPDADRIIIQDDGIGIGIDEFREHFDRVSESRKREGTDVTPAGRPMIGRIGIGFIAANEICDLMEVYSACPGSTQLLHVLINFQKMRKPIAERRRDGEDVAKADYEGEILSAESGTHFTKIFLTGVRGPAREILSSLQNDERHGWLRSFYGLRPKSIEAILERHELRSWSDLDTYSRTYSEIALNVPVRYHDGWVPPNHAEDVQEFFDAIGRLSFNVSYDSTEMRKPIVLRGDEVGTFVEKFNFEGDHVAATGYFFVRHGSVHPQELNGVLVRIRNAAVGGYDDGFMDFPNSRFPLFQKWVSSEVWTDNRLEEAMNIDRRTLRTTHPAYIELRKAFHDRLAQVLQRARSELHGEPARAKKQSRARQELARIAKVVGDSDSPLTENVQQSLARLVDDSHLDDIRIRVLTKKYTVADIYRISLEVAKTVMDDSAFQAFADQLAKRLFG